MGLCLYNRQNLNIDYIINDLTLKLKKKIKKRESEK